MMMMMVMMMMVMMNELNPGKMEVVEVGRQGEPIVFDNDQEIITAPQIVKNSKNSFSVDVKASFAPQSSRGRGQVRRQGKQQGPLVRRVERRRGGQLLSPESSSTLS